MSHSNPDSQTVPQGKSPRKKDVTAHYANHRRKLDWDLKIRELPWTEKQQRLIQLVQSKEAKCIMLTGPAGTSKSIVAVYCMLQALQSGKIGDIAYVRGPVESSSHSLGFLPGDINEKMEPYMMPFREKLDELLSKDSILKLTNEGRTGVHVVNFLRGAHFANKGIIVDECQSLTSSELVTIMTRMGESSRMILCGDHKQSDLARGRRQDFARLCSMFDNDAARSHGIFTFEFDKSDIMRSEFVKYVVDVFDNNDYGQ